MPEPTAGRRHTLRATHRQRAPPPQTVEPQGIILDLLVKRGDTLELLFRRNGLSLTDLAAMVALPEVERALKLLKPGDRLAISTVTAKCCRCAASSMSARR